VANLAFRYDAANRTLTLSIENLTDSALTITQAGYLVSARQHPIDDLSRTVLPPAAFEPLPALNRDYTPGESASVVLPDVDAAAYAIGYATVAFASGTPPQPYDENGAGTGGEWAQVAVASVATVTAEPVHPVPVGGAAMGLLVCGLGWAGLRRRRALAALALALAGLLAAAPGNAWEKGNHAGDWQKGQTINISVDTPPGDAAQQAAYWEAVYEAIAEWNDAQAPFGGLKLQVITATTAATISGKAAAAPPRKDVHISWHADDDNFTEPGGPPVEVHVGTNGMNSRGITRVLKHELGHVEGLGHSAASALMKADAYSSNPGHGPTNADLNSTAPFTSPTDDDKAGKKALFGTVAKTAAAQATSTVAATGGSFTYTYTLKALVGADYTQPIVTFALDLPAGVTPESFAVKLPAGWAWSYWSGVVAPDGRFDDHERPAPALLSFQAVGKEFGLQPGEVASFQLTSAQAPQPARGFASSAGFDSDELTLQAPGGVAAQPVDGVPVAKPQPQR